MTKSILQPKHKRENNAKLMQDNARLAELQKQHEEAKAGLNGWQQVSADPDVVREQVEEALAGRPFGPVQASESPEVLRHREGILRLAIQRQTEAVRVGEGQHAAAVCKDLGPAHKDAVKAIAQAVVELGRANAREAAIRDAIEAAGMNTMPPIAFVQFPNVGDLNDINAPAVTWLWEQVQLGHLTGRESFLEGTRAHRDNHNK